MRDSNLGKPTDASIPASVGLTEEEMYTLYRLLAIAKYDDRYVIPEAHSETARDLEELACSLDYDGGAGMYEQGPFGESSGRPSPVAVETFHALAQRQGTDTIVDAGNEDAKVNLLNWDGRGVPLGMPTMPPKEAHADSAGDRAAASTPGRPDDATRSGGAS
jgi:nitrate reductase beta subunit